MSCAGFLGKGMVFQYGADCSCGSSARLMRRRMKHHHLPNIHQQTAPTILCQEYPKGKEKEQQRELEAKTRTRQHHTEGLRSLQPWPSSPCSSEDSSGSSPSWGCPWSHPIPVVPALIQSLLSLGSSHPLCPSTHPISDVPGLIPSLLALG